VTSPEGAEGVELVLERRLGFPPARAYQKALYDAGIRPPQSSPRTCAAKSSGCGASRVRFARRAADAGPITTVLFEDGCGNLLNLVQPG
jgi:hypothetical protein